MADERLDLLKGTLDLLVLQILSSMGPRHGYGIARRLEQVSGDQLAVNEGTIYASLVRLQHRRLIKTAWGTSENNRRAKYYSLTRAGEKGARGGEVPLGAADLGYRPRPHGHEGRHRMMRDAWELLSRARAVIRRRQLDREFDEAFATHLELLTEQFARRGLPRHEARRQAILQMGGLSPTKHSEPDSGRERSS